MVAGKDISIADISLVAGKFLVGHFNGKALRKKGFRNGWTSSVNQKLGIPWSFISSLEVGFLSCFNLLRIMTRF
jgi:hypothetical protein